MCTHHWYIKDNIGTCKLCPAVKTFPSLHEQLENTEQTMAMSYGNVSDTTSVERSVKRGCERSAQYRRLR